MSDMDWLMMLAANPEWRGGASGGFSAPDVGTQASQLNYLQDVFKSGMDPFMAFMAGPEAYSQGSLDPTYEEEVIPAVTEGKDFLNAVMEKSPNSTEAMIAEWIASGGSPMDAVANAVKLGRIPQVRNEKTGQVEPDPSIVEHYRKWAGDAYSKLLSDKDEVRTQKEVANPTMQRFKEAGFEDPRQQYTASYLDPGRMSGAGMVDPMAKLREATGEYQALKNSTAQPSVSFDPGAMAKQLLSGGGLGGPQADLGSQRAASRGRQQDVRPQALGLDDAKANMMKAFAAAGTAGAADMKSRAETMAVAKFLQSQGRSPFSDQLDARMRFMAQMGVGS